MLSSTYGRRNVCNGIELSSGDVTCLNAITRIVSIVLFESFVVGLWYLDCHLSALQVCLMVRVH